MKHIRKFNEEIWFKGGEVTNKNEGVFIDKMIEELQKIKENPSGGDRLFIEDLYRTYRDRYFSDDEFKND